MAGVRVVQMVEVPYREQVLLLTPAEAWELRAEIGKVLKVYLTEEAEIVREVCEVFDLTPGHIMSDSRATRIVFARQAAMWLYRKLTPLSFVAVGERFPRENGAPRDHGTVLHAVRQIEKCVQDTANEKGRKLFSVYWRLKTKQGENKE